MADRVILAIPGLGPLVLDREVYDAAREAGAKLTRSTPCGSGAAPEPLLDADQAATQLGVTARWLEDSARAGIVPHHKFGRFIRFNVREVAAHFRIEGAAPPTDYGIFGT